MITLVKLQALNKLFSQYGLNIVSNKLAFSLYALGIKRLKEIKTLDGKRLPLSGDLYLDFHLLKAVSLSVDYQLDEFNNLILCPNRDTFKFHLPLKLGTDQATLMRLISSGLPLGTIFSSGETRSLNWPRTIQVTESSNGRSTLRMNDGSRFYLDSIEPQILVETYIMNIHDLHLDLKGKNVIDIGACFGDTSIYFARKGANVYAVEPIPVNFRALMDHLQLNSDIAFRVNPLNAAIGQDGEMTMNYSYIGVDGSASAYANVRSLDNTGGDQTTRVKSFTLNSLIISLALSKVDLLKMDCKGCECLLRVEDLKAIENVKIEYIGFNQRKLDNLLHLLEESGFGVSIFQHAPTGPGLREHGTVIGSRN